MGPQSKLLSNGTRLHLQHGPIDLILSADGERELAFNAARTRFDTILQELVGELDVLRSPVQSDSPRPHGPVALRMDKAVRPFTNENFITPMAAVAGSVADEVLTAIVTTAKLTRASVNNGGDIAFHLAPNTSYRAAMAGHDRTPLGMIDISHNNPIRGMATSGRHGRSHSLGIADSVTVLASSAAQADVAATLIANTVDLPDHPAITRRPACDLDDNTDLGARLVVTHCARLASTEISSALTAGLELAQSFERRGLIAGCCLSLQGKQLVSGIGPNVRILEHS